MGPTVGEAGVSSETKSMNKTAVLILVIFSGLQFIIQAGQSLIAAMLATGNGVLPNWASIITSMIGGLVAAATVLMPVLKALLQEYGLKMNGEASPIVKATAKVVG